MAEEHQCYEANRTAHISDAYYLHKRSLQPIQSRIQSPQMKTTQRQFSLHRRPSNTRRPVSFSRARPVAGARPCFAVAAWLAVAVALSAGALPDVDRRPSRVPERPAAAQRAKVLGQRLPQVTADWAPVTGAAHWVANRDGFLTGADGDGGAVSHAFRMRQRDDDPDRAVKAFLDEHADLFGHDASALTRARPIRAYVSEHNGLRTAAWQQEHAGLEVFEAVLIAHTTKNGELVNISSQFHPGFAEAARKAGDVPRPVLSAAQAVVAAARDLGHPEAREAEVAGVGPSEGTERRQKFRSPVVRREAHTRLVWLPMDASTLRLCWEVALRVRARAEVYRLLVAADTGEVLVRRCQTETISTVSYRIVAGDSPTPMSPGYASPGNTNQPATVARTLTTLSAISVTASPNGWIDDGVNETRGNNVDASTDWDDDDVLDLPRPQGSPSRVFDFTLNLNQAPSAYAKAAVVNLFYWCNWMHDKLYALGFNEAAGNFQANNFGKGGVAGDAVRAEAQDGGGTDNANFNYTSAADGSQPWIQMYVWPNATPDRDGDLDTQIMLHEYTHGLSGRLVGAGVGLSGTQPKGMGEGWSDFYALALLSKAADPLDGNYPVGAYAMKDFKRSPAVAPLLENYYYGIRRYPYSTRDQTRVHAVSMR